MNETTQHQQYSESISRIFKRLGDKPTNIDPNVIAIIAKDIYNCSAIGSSLIALRLRQLLNTPSKCLWTLVPSVSAIGQYVRRACIQAGYLWKLSQLELDILDPIFWGWKLSSVSKFSNIPLWKDCTLPDVHISLKTCSCTKRSCYNRSFKEIAINCMKFCKCEESDCKNRLCSEN